jgi:hypothetical protein
MMEKVAAFFRWLGTPIRAIRGLFPFTYDGRQTLIYLMCALSAPVLTLAVMYLTEKAADANQWPEHRELARIVAYSLLVSVCAFSMFVAFRTLSLGSKDGLLNLSSKDTPPPDPVLAAKHIEDKVATAAKEAVADVAVAAAQPAPNTNPAGEPL